MKNNFFFSAISIAMIFASIFAMSLLTSCAPNACCGGGSGVKTQQQQTIVVTNPETKLEAREVIIVDGAIFTGWCFCYYLSYGPWVDVRDKDGNDLHVIRCNDHAILNKLDVDMCFWDYSTGPAGVGGKGPAIVMMYSNGTLAKVQGYPKYIESEFLVTHFYGKTLGKNGLFERYSELPNPYLDKLNYNTLPKELKVEFNLGKLVYGDSVEFKMDSTNSRIEKSEKMIFDLNK